MGASAVRIRDTLDRILDEFQQLPSLRLTVAQAARLWTLDRSVCDALLAALVDARFLVRTPDGAFVRAGEALN
jgi:DNA-binding IclR family transcriptional regulator